MAGFRTLDSLEVKGKRVLLRVDLNVPVENGVVTDATRIARAAPTMTELADKGAKVILLSHFGRPKGRDLRHSLKPVVAEIERIIKRPVAFAADCVGDIAEHAVAKLKSGQILCLENTRFHAGEEKNDPAFVDALAKLGDLWVNDAFSAAHRAHASTEGLGHRLPAYAGRAMQAELEALTRALEDPQRPLTAIVGGAKISTKLDLLGHLSKKVDKLVIGGAMANTLLLAQGHQVGKSLVERDLVATARGILAEAESQQKEIVLPLDAVVAKKFEAHAPARTVEIDAVGDDDIILDIGPRSLERVISVLERSRTLVWNGPLGAFETEPFGAGTFEVAKAAADLSGTGRLVAVAGGGDTVAALNAAGVASRLTYVSTAGGAFLEWLEGKVLPGVEVLRVK
ncbi:MAG: phosphoglycerate kinase [Pseudolabrys sp.]|nr:phosphoglycerate kinase [Pseudolabrys sp.]